jgi:GNAT superfamily N-acetyltransferase
MHVDVREVPALGFRHAALSDGREIGHGYLYVLGNDLHAEPFALGEDLQVAEEFRSTPAAHLLIDAAVRKARECGCYKLILTSRFSNTPVHRLMRFYGADRHGYEFRLDL